MRRCRMAAGKLSQMQRSEPPRESERFRGKTGAFSEQNRSEPGKRQLDTMSSMLRRRFLDSAHFVRFARNDNNCHSDRRGAWAHPVVIATERGRRRFPLSFRPEGCAGAFHCHSDRRGRRPRSGGISHYARNNREYPIQQGMAHPDARMPCALPGALWGCG